MLICQSSARQTRGGLTETTDRSNAVIRPPIAWALAFAAGLAINWFYPLHWIPATWPNVWIGVIVFAAGFALAREEAYLERKFGDVYSDYKSRVRRWF